MRFLNFTLLIFLIIFIAGCASVKPDIFEKNNKASDPVLFFDGHTHSYGVMENAGGKPVSEIRTETVGVLKDSLLHIEQDLYPGGGKKNHRSFSLRIKDAHHIEGTAGDIAGTAHGLLYGNEFSWTFRLKLTNRKFIKHVRMSQYMYLMPDGKSMIIRSVIRKFFFKVAQITEEFQKT